MAQPAPRRLSWRAMRRVCGHDRLASGGRLSGRRAGECRGADAEPERHRAAGTIETTGARGQADGRRTRYGSTQASYASSLTVSAGRPTARSPPASHQDVDTMRLDELLQSIRRARRAAGTCPSASARPAARRAMRPRSPPCPAPSCSDRRSAETRSAV